MEPKPTKPISVTLRSSCCSFALNLKCIRLGTTSLLLRSIDRMQFLTQKGCVGTSLVVQWSNG